MQGCVSQNGYILLERVPENAKMGTYHLEHVPENAKTGTYHSNARRTRTFEKSAAAKEKINKTKQSSHQMRKTKCKWASSFRLTRARVRAYQGFCTFCFHNLHTYLCKSFLHSGLSTIFKHYFTESWLQHEIREKRPLEKGIIASQKMMMWKYVCLNL